MRRSAGVFSPATWAEALYAVVDLAPAITFFVLSVTMIALGVSLTVIYVGVPILALALLIARAGGHLQRVLAAALLDLPSVRPVPIRRRRPGPIGALTSILRDPGCWRAVTYHCIKILLAPVTFAFAVAFYSAGLGAITNGLWQRYLPYQSAADGSLHRGMQWWPNYFVDTWPRMLLLAVAGALLLAAAPRVVRFFTTIDRMLITTLLSG
ncbi:Putative sensor [Nakamurella panacisegetis]|uniref:Putative sensor n=1 Tax=Nakamurella panacisegetis TaxID=1090615 RepID=A0A1H0HRW7_9ACTN|nr:sensor domain-containing protein [Nakamurella panacisegetis]SDO21906.1 Putative sensor [Nakamurella panacisegetis]